MDIDTLKERYPRVSRLLAGQETSMAAQQDVLANFQRDPGVFLVAIDNVPVMLIGLDRLESALSGFRDTGTWDDYFPPANDSNDDIKLRPPRGPGKVRYRIDVDDGEDNP